MWYSRALFVAVVAVPLVVGSGCVTKQTYDRDIQVERDKTVKAQKDFAQAKADLKKAYDTIADLTQKTTALASVQQQLAAEQKHAEGLQASIKVRVEEAKKAQEHADAMKLTARDKEVKSLTEQLHKAHEQIAELKRELEKPRKEAPVTPPTPPVMPPVTPPVTPPASPQ
jgi:predicted RNase H-like nuclease (RuvC/YqgF family)